MLGREEIDVWNSLFVFLALSNCFVWKNTSCCHTTFIYVRNFSIQYTATIDPPNLRHKQTTGSIQLTIDSPSCQGQHQ